MNHDDPGIYGSIVGIEHRRKFGQYFTPPAIATFMCQWALEGGAREVHDPAVGLGVFHSAARAIAENVSYSGDEIDPVILKHFRRSGQVQHPATVSQKDYLGDWGRKHPAIVCNPPYMRFQNFLNRDEVFRAFREKIGLRLSGYTNCASAFLLKSLSELTEGGRLAYIMPLEFLNAGYGTLVKSQLLLRGQLKAFIRLKAEKEIFPDAITSVGIILVADDGREAPVRFYSLDSLSELPAILSTEPQASVPLHDLSPADKWLKYFENRPDFIDHGNLVSIREYGAFSRGIATGANEFFVLSTSKARELKIPRTALSYCISKSNQVRQSIFTDETLKKMEQDNAEILLLDVKGESSPAVRDYIHAGEERGFHLRYLTKMRRPWYKVEHRTPAPLLFGVFSRGSFKVIRNSSNAVNLTCFHGFYPNMFGAPYVDRLFLYFQSKAARTLLGHSMRRYGDGLDKFEPNDLNNALAPAFSWFDQFPQELVELGMQACALGHEFPSAVDEQFQLLLKNVDPPKHSGTVRHKKRPAQLEFL